MFKSYNTWKTPKFSSKNNLTRTKDEWYYKEKVFEYKDSEGNDKSTFVRVLFYKMRAINPVF